MMYIDTCTFDDYDKVIRYLLEKRIPIRGRNKLEMVVAAEVSATFVQTMLQEVDFDEEVSFGEKPLDPSALQA